ncbi:MAG: C4-dicarboxylate ABC transporter substrate-binding protein, partial [Desulfobacterales bacterium]|nr:C4-dicarboxylate ABC transporter substrate-binding protein [Desulfobacterales bacterium]
VYADLAQLKKAHDKFKNISMEAGLVGMGIPLHPGAEQYFKEKGVLK